MSNKTLDVKVLQALVYYSQIHTVTGVVDAGTMRHEEAWRKARQWIWDNFKAVDGEYQPKGIVAREESEVDIAPNEVIDFAMWYSGMSREKIETAYKRYKNETTKQPGKEFLPDELAVVQHKETKLYHGAYYRNKPTPSGCDRFILQTTTTKGYETEFEAAKAIEAAFPNMPKISDKLLNKESHE